MGNNTLGLIGLIIGVSILTGGEAVTPGANTALVGGMILAGGLALTALGAWEGYAAKRLKVLGKEAAAGQIERLALLKEQGRLTEEEFASAKRHILGEEHEDDQVFATDDDFELERLARLKAQGVLTDEEFADQKLAILLELNLKRLNRLLVEQHLTEYEYGEQKQKILAEYDEQRQRFSEGISPGPGSLSRSESP